MCYFDLYRPWRAITPSEQGEFVDKCEYAVSKSIHLKTGSSYIVHEELAAS